MNDIVEFAREHSYVETLFGRRRPIDEIRASSTFVREGAERIAINTPIQGTSADIIKIAMIALHKTFINEGLKSSIILQVHDELVCEVPEGELERVKVIVRDCMENAAKLSVPLVADIGWGKSWGEAH
jgi:DNA polymerase I